jgi:hypothetical protein
MQSIANSRGYHTEILLTKDATTANFLSRLNIASKNMVAGDTFLLSLACHGSQIEDTQGDEPDGQDETWCLYDRMILDDEVYNAFGQFKPGVRIIVYADSCHSGSSTRVMIAALKSSGSFPNIINITDSNAGFRCIDPYIDIDAFSIKYQPYYNSIKSQIPAFARGSRFAQKYRAYTRSSDGPDVLLVSACKDSQVAGDGVANGFFTQNLKAVWDGGKFQGSHADFKEAISKRMNTPAQQPQLFVYGPTSQNLSNERPFSMSSSDNRSSAAMGQNEGMIRCHMEMPEGILRGLSKENIEKLLTQQALPLLTQVCADLCEATPQMRSMTIGQQTRRGWEVGCKADSGGGLSCEGKISGSW